MVYPNLKGVLRLFAFYSFGATDYFLKGLTIYSYFSLFAFTSLGATDKSRAAALDLSKPQRPLKKASQNHVFASLATPLLAELARGLEPLTFGLQIRCSTN